MSRNLTLAQSAALKTRDDLEDAKVVGWQEGPVLRRGDGRLQRINPKGRLVAARKETA